MEKSYQFIQNLADMTPTIPSDSILSRTFFNGENKAILFAFAAGQELSEHTASRPAILHFLQGEARLSLGGDEYQVQPGAWVHMPAQMAHSIYANTPVVMLLYLV